MKQPCERDCPDRSMMCKYSCSKWAEFEAWKEQEYKRRRERGQASNDANAVELKRLERIRKR
jgi:hypothetical protein